MRSKSLSGAATRSARAEHVQKLLDDVHSKLTKENADVRMVLVRNRRAEKLVVRKYQEATKQHAGLTDIFDEGCVCEVWCQSTIHDDADWWDAKVVKIDAACCWTRYIQQAPDGSESLSTSTRKFRYEDVGKRIRLKRDGEDGEEGEGVEGDAEEDSEMEGEEPEVLQQVRMEDFAAVNAPLMKDFVRARSAIRLSDVPLSSLPVKGTEAQALAGEDTLWKRAFEMRMLPVKLQIQAPATQTAVATIKPTLVTHDVCSSEERVITQMMKASTCLQDAHWQARVKASLIGRAQDFAITVEVEVKCDLVCERVLTRLEQHLTERVAPDRRNHWCVDLFRANVGILSAILGGINGHIRGNIDTNHIHPDESLLVPIAARFLKVFDGHEDKEGCYLLGTDREEGIVTEIERSGKVCSGSTVRRMGKRYWEHQSASKLDQERPSRFNMTYPSRDVAFDDPIRRGDFEDLTMYVGTAFDRNDDEALKAICATDGTGIFEWPPHVLRNLKSTAWGSMELQAKQLNMVSFMLELVYDLCISRQIRGTSRLNLSDSPGFEKFLRDFRGE